MDWVQSGVLDDTCALATSTHSDIGQQLKKRRLELKKTRKQMAKELRICAKTLWGWETTRHKPSLLRQLDLS